MVITFWAGTYKTKEEVQFLIDSLDIALYEVRKRVDCWSKESCKDCKAKSPCKDLFRLHEHLENVARDF